MTRRELVALICAILTGVVLACWLSVHDQFSRIG